MGSVFYWATISAKRGKQISDLASFSLEKLIYSFQDADTIKKKKDSTQVIFFSIEFTKEYYVFIAFSCSSGK